MFLLELGMDPFPAVIEKFGYGNLVACELFSGSSLSSCRKQVFNDVAGYNITNFFVPFRS